MADIFGFFMLLAMIAGVASYPLTSRWNHDRLRRLVRLTDQESEDVRTALLGAVRDASYNQWMRVSIGRFWNDSGLKTSEQYFIIEPLLKSGTVFVPDDPDKFDSAYNYAFCNPPRVLVLSDRDWTRMVHEGISPRWIIRSLTQTVTNQEINSGGGSVNATAAGRDARDVRQNMSKIEWGRQEEILRDIHAALIRDAKAASQADAERLNTLADSVQGELASKKPSDERFHGIISRVKGTADVLGNAMSATASVLAGLKSLGL